MPASTRSGWKRIGHGPVLFAYDRVKQATRLETDRPIALREAIMACRNGGTVSVIGVYGGFIDKFPIGSLMNRSLTIKTGQCSCPPLHAAAAGAHRARRDRPELRDHAPHDSGRAPRGYEIFKHKQDDCMKVVLTP